MNGQACLALLAIAAATMAVAQQPATVQPVTRVDGANLPFQKVGPNDLLGVSVYGAPELSRTVRVAADGVIHLPMLKERILAAGLLPAELEVKIAGALVKEGLLVEPVVTISVVEYRSRPISIVGAVRRPVTFQAEGDLTVLDAISRAEGLADNAGPEILVAHSQTGTDGTTSIVRRIPVKALLDGSDPALNVKLRGGEVIRVPEAGRVFVVGNVRKPGAYPISDGATSSLMKMLALSEGALPYSQDVAYIYRGEGEGNAKTQIPFDLKKIIERKAPDVPVLAGDIVYIPENAAKHSRMDTLGKVALFGGGVASALVYGLMH